MICFFKIISFKCPAIKRSGFMIWRHFKEENRKENCKTKEEGKKNSVLEMFSQISLG